MPRKRTKYGEVVSDEQALEAMQWIDELRERKFTWGRIESIMGYKSGGMPSRILAGERRPAQPAYDRLRSFMENGAVRKAEPPTRAVRKPPVDDDDCPFPPTRTTVLDDLAHARKSLDTAIADVKRASQTSVPLLRPGLEQLAGKLSEARRWLEVA